MTPAARHELERVLDEQVRPLLSSHLGDAHVERVDADGVVHLRFEGACASCGYRKTTLLTAVYPRIRHVEGVTGVTADGVPTTRAEERRIVAVLDRYGAQRGGRRST